MTTKRRGSGKKKSGKPRHDRSYKRLFSHPELVRDLLTGFVHEECVNQLDLDTLEKMNGSYVADGLREREDDIIWRVRWGDGWIYVYLLLEFQSSIDKAMAVRLLGGCPRIAIVARARLIESDFSII